MVTTVSPTDAREVGVPKEAPRRRRRAGPGVLAVVLGGLSLLGADAWSTFAVPSLVRFPTNVDLEPRYSGTFTLFVDPATAAPLANPTPASLTVQRHVESSPDPSDDGSVVVLESISYQVTGLPDVTQEHQYVMDRRSVMNLADDRAWAFERANHLDRSGAYWVTLPRGTDGSSSLPMFKDETAATFTIEPTYTSESVDGLRLVGFDGRAAASSLTDAYLRALDAVTPLPRSLTFAQLQPSLVAAGVPIEAALQALAQVATPEDLKALVTMAAQPIPLQYVDSFSGRTFVEPDTGAIVDVNAVDEQIGVRPDPSALPALLSVLERYRGTEPIGQAIDALSALSSRPLPVFEYRYAQDVSSVHEVATWVGDQRDRMTLAEQTIPRALFGIGIALTAVGTAWLLFRRFSRRPS